MFILSSFQEQWRDSLGRLRATKPAWVAPTLAGMSLRLRPCCNPLLKPVEQHRASRQYQMSTRTWAPDVGSSHFSTDPLSCGPFCNALMEQLTIKWLREVVIHPCRKALRTETVSAVLISKQSLIEIGRICFRYLLHTDICSKHKTTNLLAVTLHSICSHCNNWGILVDALTLTNAFCGLRNK